MPNADLQTPLGDASASKTHSSNSKTRSKSRSGGKPTETTEQTVVRTEQERRQNIITMFNRIDEITLKTIGLKPKASLGERAIADIHEYSMLQRFRQEKDLNSFERARPVHVQSDESEGSDSDEDACENINIKNLGATKTMRAFSPGLSALKKEKPKQEAESKWWVR
jgi:hypothetical protein